MSQKQKKWASAHFRKRADRGRRIQKPCGNDSTVSALGSVVDGAVETCLREAQVRWRRVAEGEWGIVAEAGGWPLHVGLARRGGLLRAQAEVLAESAGDTAGLLRRNRRLELVRLASSEAGAIWVEGEIPERAAVYQEEVDRLLGSLLRAADEVRAVYAARRRAMSR